MTYMVRWHVVSSSEICPVERETTTNDRFPTATPLLTVGSPVLLDSARPTCLSPHR